MIVFDLFLSRAPDFAYFIQYLLLFIGRHYSEDTEILHTIFIPSSKCVCDLNHVQASRLFLMTI